MPGIARRHARLTRARRNVGHALERGLLSTRVKTNEATNADGAVIQLYAGSPLRLWVGGMFEQPSKLNNHDEAVLDNLGEIWNRDNR